MGLLRKIGKRLKGEGRSQRRRKRRRTKADVARKLGMTPDQLDQQIKTNNTQGLNQAIAQKVNSESYGSQYGADPQPSFNTGQSAARSESGAGGTAGLSGNRLYIAIGAVLVAVVAFFATRKKRR